MKSKAEREERALRYFADHLHCSQSILAAFSEECGISEETAFRLGSCFGSGMRRGNVCGACTGALMVLGLKYGETHAGDQEGRLRTNRLNDLMMDRFSEANGSCICNELLGCDVRRRKAYSMPGTIICLRNSARRWWQAQLTSWKIS